MKLYILTFNWYMGIDGSGTNIIGVYQSNTEAENAMQRYLKNNSLADEPYNQEYLGIEEYDLDKDAWDAYS